MDALYDWEFIDVEELQGYVETNGVAGIEKLFKKKLEGWREIEVNMAITGFSGTGKSSFINAIRELEDDDDNAAKVGVTECTTEPTCFFHPRNDKIKFWDLPGIGTPTYPTLEIYCSKVDLESYDTFLIFTATRFTEYDMALARQIRSLKKNFFLIRTKIDDNVRSEERKKSFNEEVMLKEIRDKCFQNLEDLVQNSRDIFLISNHYPAKWEFARLTQAILDVLPIRQRESLTLSLGVLASLSTDILQNKIQILRSRIWKVAAASAAAALVPLPGLSIAVDLSLLTNEISFYRSQLGLPEVGSAEFLGLTPDNQEKVRRFILTTATQMSGFVTAYCAESTIEEFTRYIPFVGLAIASSMSFGTTYYFLQRCLTDMEKTSFSVLDDISVQSVGDLELE